MPVDPSTGSGRGGSGTLVTQLTDVVQRKPDPKLTDSQKFIKEEEQKLIDAVRERVEERQKREEKEKKERPPTVRTGERPAVSVGPDAVP